MWRHSKLVSLSILLMWRHSKLVSLSILLMWRHSKLVSLSILLMWRHSLFTAVMEEVFKKAAISEGVNVDGENLTNLRF